MSKKFINKKEAIIVRLTHRDKDDPNYDKNSKSQIVYQIVQEPRDEDLDEQGKKFKDSILGMFTEKDQGIYDLKQAERKRMIKEIEEMNYLPAEHKKQLGGQDLWIHHLQRMKLEKLKKELEEEKQQAGQFDDDQEFEEVEEIEEIEEIEEYEEEEEDEEYREQLKKMNPLQKQILYADSLPDYKKFKISENIKMKEFDPNRILISQGFKPEQDVDFSDQGQLVASFSVVPKVGFTPDIDYKLEEMTEEQKEVFESLQNEELEYDCLEDDFVKLAQGDDEVILQKVEQEKEKKQVTFEDQQQKKKPKKKTEEINLSDEEFSDYEVEQAQQELELMQKQQDQYFKEQQKEIINNANNKKSNPKNDNGDEYFDKTPLDNIDKDSQSSKSREDLLVDEEYDEEDLENVLDEFETDGPYGAEYIAEDKFNNILSDHIDDMIKRGENIQLLKEQQKEENKNKAGQPKIKQKDPKTTAKDEREKELIEKYGDQAHIRQKYYALSYHEDKALQNYLEREANISSDHDSLADVEIDKPEMESETIATKEFNTSTVHLNLNVINPQRKIKKPKEVEASSVNIFQQQNFDASKQKEEEEAKEKTTNVKIQENQENSSKTIQDVFVKRDKKETSQERKARKEQIKNFKKERKDKKREKKIQFKEQVGIKVQENIRTQKGEGRKGVSIVVL